MSNLNQPWGRSVPEEMHDKIAVTWGARAIYTHQTIDLLPDRQTWIVPGQDVQMEHHKPLVESLAAWINTKGLPFLRKESKNLYTNESRVVTLDDGKFHIEASPQVNHGYLYIRAWELHQ